MDTPETLSQNQLAKSNKNYTDTDLANELCDITLSKINSLFGQFLQDANQRLFNMAEAATSNEHQNSLFQVITTLRQSGDQLKQSYNQCLKTRITNEKLKSLNTHELASDFLQENMQLIDLEEFEDWLSMDSVIKRGNKRYYKDIACLEKRYSQLMHQTISNEQLPPSIDNICYALQDSLKQQSFDPEILPIIYRLFEGSIVSHLDDLYDNLNRKLKSCGILPNIESEILRDRRGAKTQPLSTSPVDNDAKLDPQSNHQQTPDNLNTPQLYQATQNILEMLHQKTINDSAKTSDVSVNNQLGSTQQIIDALEQLQKNPEQYSNLAFNSENQSITENGNLISLLQQASDFRVDNQSGNTINYIERIFNQLGDYTHISAPLLTAIKQLAIPVTKSALLDNNFLGNDEHPAHKLLNQLIELCQNSDMPNQSLEKRFNTIAEDINHNFQQDSSVFQQAINDLQPIAQQQSTAYQRNTQRITQTYNGRQRIKKAEQMVKREIQRRLTPPQAADVIIELIENGWQELLKLTYIKAGENSSLWQEQLSTLDQLILWIAGFDNNDSPGDEAESGQLEADSFANLIEQQLSDVFPSDYRYQDTIEKIRSTLKGQRPITLVDLPADYIADAVLASEIQLQHNATRPELIRWFKRAKNLNPGDEFAYLDDETDERNIRLAWVSDDKQQFIFVNHRGQKVLDFSLPELANELSQGLSPTTESAEWPLVERSLYSTVQEAYEKLAYNSSHDELTGLFSRKECERLLNQALLDSKNEQHIHSLLYIDIDKFSLPNNLYGHEAGDQLIVDTGHILNKNAPKNSVLARMAGNEFVILLQDSDTEDASLVANKIRKRIESHPFKWQQHSVKFTISIGLITINKHTQSVVNLLRDSISACQIAKQQGGNRLHDALQDLELHDKRDKYLTWINQLDDILNSDHMALRVQKISPINSEEKEEHYEVLLAIKDEQGELGSPIDFIETAEYYNRMQHVDRWVIENSFKWLAALLPKGIEPPALSINLSGNSLNDENFLDFILEQFSHYKIPTQKICFEVTETATINNLTEAADFIREVKKMGCKFSLDDFGSGNASYQYLRHLPVDYIKIDGMFVKDIAKNSNDYALVKSINEIAHLMGKKTIAEFAENDEIISILKEIGVDYAQGYAIYRPAPLADLSL